MPVINVKVGAGADDGNWFSTTLINNSLSIRVGKQTTIANHGFFRFDNITIEGTINDAHVTIRSAGNLTNTVPIRIYGVLENDPATVASAADGDGRTLTTAFVDWTPGDWSIGSYYDTPDLSTIIQELIDEGYTYDGSQAIMLFFKDNGAADTVNRTIRSYEHSSTESAADLEIDYSPLNATPTVILNTADAVTLSDTPTVEFTGTDAESDDITYEIQISDDPNFSTDGIQVTDSLTEVGSGGLIHPNPISSELTWQGEVQLDDRPGQSFTATGGILDKVRFRFAGDTLASGNALARIYNITGTHGTDATPLNPALPDDTPTPGWIAESALVAVTSADGMQWWDFTFSGANRIRFTAGQHYMVIIDWQPDTDDYDNTIEVQGNASTPHAGNAYIDGDSANNGVNLTFDTLFEVYEDLTTLDKASDTDSGFNNTINGGDTDPFTSGNRISYTVQAADTLDDGVTYHWRVRASDPSGSNLWSDYTASRSFTVDSDLDPGDDLIVGHGLASPGAGIAVGVGI